MKTLTIFTALCFLAIHATPAHALDVGSVVSQSERLELCYYANTLHATATNPQLAPKVKSKLLRKDAAGMAKRWDEVKALYPLTSEAFATVYQNDVTKALSAAVAGQSQELVKLTDGLRTELECTRH